MDSVKKLKDGWQSYLDEVVPKDAPQIQKIECKRAFYAGASLALKIISEISFSDISLVKGVDEIRELVRECNEFVEKVKTKKE